MGKIKFFPEVKANYIAYHKILWQAIIDELKALKVFCFKRSGDYKLAHTFKIGVFDKLFEFKQYTKNFCFPCEYCHANCKKCLFDVNNIHEGGCLNGKWNNFNGAIEEKNKEDAIKYARQIKNFKVR